MAVNNAATYYQGTKVNTASPAELTLMLYEGAIKFCNIALLGFETGDTEKVNNNVIKVQKIITEFRATLDFKYPTAKDFDVVYEYIASLLVQANVKKDPEYLEKALEQIREMRDLWKEIMKRNHMYVK
ncbi:MAG: flagellar export chaperone FliS [Lachnospiraceae bacterium]|nr:flagellar export chaperone FliS [Lachnospiraceae bacterium]